MLPALDYLLLPWASTTGGATIGLSNDAVSLIKVYIPAPMTATTVAFEAVSTSDGVLWGFGIYSLDGNTLLIDSGPIVTPVHGGGSVIVQGTFTAQSIGSGMYWMAYTCDTFGSGLRPVAVTAAGDELICDGSSIIGTAANTSTGGQLPATTGTITLELAPGSSIAPLTKWQ